MSATVMSVGDFIRESELFPYSKENYELVKEASELNLMTQYIESQRFYLENVDLAGIDKNLTEGFLLESAGEDQLQLLEETAGAKMDSFLTKAHTFFTGLIDKFINFLSRMLESSKKLDEKSDQIVKLVGSVSEEEFGAEKVASLLSACEAAAKSCDISFAEKGGSTGKRLFKSKASRGGNPTQAATMERSGSHIDRVLGDILKKKEAYIIPGQKCNKAMAVGDFSQLLTNNPDRGILSPKFKDEMEKIQNKTRNSGIYVSFAFDGINKELTRLKAIRKDLNIAQKKDDSGADMSKENFAEARLMVAHSMSFLSSAHRFRSLIVNKVLAALNEKEAPEKPAEDPKGSKKEDAGADDDKK